MSLNVALSSAGVFLFFKELGKKINWNENSRSVTCMTNLSVLTFGIYLIHFLFVRIGARNFHMFKLMPNTFLAVPIISVIIFIISTIIAYIIHQIPWFKNHIM
jgi:surface polysaccharide O-acyltransferase-like enzyme